jgi:hypothetical protein
VARLLQVSLDANDATGAANTAAIKAALTGIGSYDGIQLPPGTFRVYATSGSVAPMPVGKGIYGTPIALGAEPTTKLLLVGSDSTTANVVAVASAGLAQGISVKDLYIDGGRTGGWATASYVGACMGLAGQNDYASPHNVAIDNCWFVDGLTQQLYFNSINTGAIRYVKAWATAAPVQASHGCDFDAVANSKRSKFITISDCDFDAYGQECMKLENSSDFTISRTTFRMYVSLTQDVTPYDELGRITFDQCTFLAHVGLTRIKLTLGGGTGGDGTVTWNRCTFGDAGMIKSEDATVANYGTQTITYCTFSRFGNSFKFPAGVTYVSTGNLFAEMPTKRFARVSNLDKYGAGLVDAGTGPNAYMARETCATGIATAVTASANGEEVWVLNGTYPGTTGSNRSLTCGGKTITLRAETKFGVVLDLSGGSGYLGFNQSADIAGHLIWGFVCYGAGLGGGNGAGASITAGDSYMRSMAFIKCKTGNSGAGYRNTSTGTSVLEDFVIADSDLQTSHGALYVSQASPVGTVTISRGRVLRSTANNANGGAVRIDNANTTVNGLEVVGNVNTGGSGGCAFTKACTVTNLTCAGNTGSATSHDVNVSAAVTGDSWVCWSDDATATKSVNVASSTLTLDKATIFGGSGAVTGAGTKTLTNIISTDPLFADAVGGNYQLKNNSPSRGVGVQRAGMADGFNRPFAYDAASANHGAWA